MLPNHAEIEVTRQDGRKEIIDAVPIYRTEGNIYVDTGAFQLFADYSDYEEEGADHPGFLGELRFNAKTPYEWQYVGDWLTGAEVLQIVDALQANKPLFLLGNDADSLLTFTYDHFDHRRYIQIVPDDNCFLVFINGLDSATIEPAANGWAVTTIAVLEDDLENELIRRVEAYKP